LFILNMRFRSLLGYYGSLTIKKGGYLSPPEWDGQKGGVLVIVAHLLTIEKGGTLSATGHGYRGGERGSEKVAYQGESWTGQGKDSRLANGGGGGGSIPFIPGLLDFRNELVCFSGAGGSFATQGERATVTEAKYESYVGHPGETYDPFLHVPETLLGSGGGTGCYEYSNGSLVYRGGSRGGGAIIIRVHTLRLDGSIWANGELNEVYYGGGGSGGLVLIVADHIEGSGIIEARGGLGSCEGGDGHIIIRSPDANTTKIFYTGQVECYPTAKIENNLDFPDLSSLRL
jgi:hypothetical protein